MDNPYEATVERVVREDGEVTWEVRGLGQVVRGRRVDAWQVACQRNQKQLKRVVESAVQLLGSDLCKRHLEEAKAMPFDRFADRDRACGCAWCNSEAAQEEAERLREALDVIGRPRRGTDEERMSFDDCARFAREAADRNRPDDDDQRQHAQEQAEAHGRVLVEKE